MHVVLVSLRADDKDAAMREDDVDNLIDIDRSDSRELHFDTLLPVPLHPLRAGVCVSHPALYFGCGAELKETGVTEGDGGDGRAVSYVGRLVIVPADFVIFVSVIVGHETVDVLVECVAYRIA